MSKWAEGRCYHIFNHQGKTNCIKLSKSIILLYVACSADVMEIVLQTQNFSMNANPIARRDTHPWWWTESSAGCRAQNCWSLSLLDEVLEGPSHGSPSKSVTFLCGFARSLSSWSNFWRDPSRKLHSSCFLLAFRLC